MDIFVTGTDTDVGKTVITAGLAAVMQSLGYEISVYKPFQSGAIEGNKQLISPDLSFVKQIDDNIKTKYSYIMKAPTTPSVAAELEGIVIDKKKVLKDFGELKQTSDIVITEGAGGLMVPVNNELLMSDIVKMLNLPVVIVARATLGTINHTLMTVKMAQSMGINVLGVIINRYPLNTKDKAIKTAPSLIRKFSGVKLFGIIPDISSISDGCGAEFLIDSIINNLNLEDVVIQDFSPTGFFSSAIKNTFLERLIERKNNEIQFSHEKTEEFSEILKLSETKVVYIRSSDSAKAKIQIEKGFTEIKETPDNTVVFLTPDEWVQMKEDRKNCVGCLSQCQFSAWSQAKGNSGRLPDPRSYCIHKTLYDVSHNGSIVDNLLFAGHQVYRFATDPLYRNGIPSVKELIEKIKAGY